MNLQRALAVALSSLLLFGCSAKQKRADFTEETPQPGSPGGSGGYYSMLYVGEGQELEIQHILEMDDNDVNACLVEAGGILRLRDIEIRKTGDATGMVVSGGGHAACAARSGGRLYVTGAGTIITEGYGAHALYGDGKDTGIEADGLILETRGDTSAGIFLKNGAHAFMKNCSMKTEQENAPCILLSGDSVFESEKVTLQAKAAMIEILDGNPRITISEGDLTGNIRIADEGGLDLQLNATKWIGTVPSDSESSLNLEMAADCSWTMTEDASVSGFVDRDQTLANIDSNGFVIYYDYDNPINAWIGGQTLPLPGGGFLTPII